MIVNTEIFQANGTAERDAALVMLEQVPAGSGHGGSRQGLRYAGLRGRVPAYERDTARGQNTERSGGSAIDGRTARHAGYEISQKKRKRIEECFGWMKTSR